MVRERERETERDIFYFKSKWNIIISCSLVKPFMLQGFLIIIISNKSPTCASAGVTPLCKTKTTHSGRLRRKTCNFKILLKFDWSELKINLARRCNNFNRWKRLKLATKKSFQKISIRVRLGWIGCFQSDLILCALDRALKASFLCFNTMRIQGWRYCLSKCFHY